MVPENGSIGPFAAMRKNAGGKGRAGKRNREAPDTGRDRRDGAAFCGQEDGRGRGERGRIFGKGRRSFRGGGTGKGGRHREKQGAGERRQVRGTAGSGGARLPLCRPPWRRECGKSIRRCAWASGGRMGGEAGAFRRGGDGDAFRRAAAPFRGATCTPRARRL